MSRLIPDVRILDDAGVFKLICGSGDEGVPVCGSLSSTSSFLSSLSSAGSLSSGSLSSISLISSEIYSSMLFDSSSSFLSSEYSSEEDSDKSSEYIPPTSSSTESSYTSTQSSTPPEPSNCRYVPCSSDEPSEESTELPPIGSGDPPTGGSTDSELPCVYSICPSELPSGEQPPPGSEESDKDSELPCVYSICPSSDASSITSSGESSAEESSLGVQECGTPGKGPAMIITLSWTGPDVEKQWNDCTWRNNESKIVWPLVEEDFVWQAWDDPEQSPDRNVFGGKMIWQWGGLRFKRSARGQAEPFGDYTDGLKTLSAYSAGRIYGANIIGATTSRAVPNVKQGYKWNSSTVSYYSDPLGIQPAWSTSGITVDGNIGMNAPGHGTELGGGVNVNLNVAPAPGTSVTNTYALLQGVYTDNQNNDPITISWTPYAETWAEGSADGVAGEMGQEPEYQPMIHPFAGSGVAACGGPNTDPTIFMTLTWSGGSTDKFDISDMQLLANNLLQVTTDGTNNINVGDYIRFSGTDTRQRIDGTGEELKEWFVLSTSGDSFVVDPNTNHTSGLQILDPAAGQVENLSSGSTKSWLGCTWRNGETKELYTTSYELKSDESPNNMWERWIRSITVDNAVRMRRTYQNSNGFGTRDGATLSLDGPENTQFDMFRVNSSPFFNYNTANIGILNVGDVGQGPGDYRLLGKQKNNTFTDASGVTYDWTEGNGW
jgi:hypothetical protein